MKRSPLERKTPLAPGKSTLKRSPMARGQSRMRASKPKSEKPKRAARNAGPDWLAMCRGQRCYLAIPGVCNHDPATVVPAHSNSLARGKGMGLKAPDIYTLPACHCCHMAIDQSKDLDKEARRELWERAYAQWEADRKFLFKEAVQQQQIPEQKM